jgi:hypothetical protein
VSLSGAPWETTTGGLLPVAKWRVIHAMRRPYFSFGVTGDVPTINRAVVRARGLSPSRDHRRSYVRGVLVHDGAIR